MEVSAELVLGERYDIGELEWLVELRFDTVIG